MLGVPYHCGNCERLVESRKLGQCAICGSTSIVPAGWYQLSMPERSEWVERIQGRRKTSDPWRLDQPGIRPRVQHPPLQACTAASARYASSAPAPQIPAESFWLDFWRALSAWVLALLGPREAEPAAVSPEPARAGAAPEPITPVVRMLRPDRPRARPTRPAVWSRQYAPRARVRSHRTARARRHPVTTRFGRAAPRRRRLRLA